MTQNSDNAPLFKRVPSMCAKCMALLDHEVVSMYAKGTIKKVRCLTCGTEQKYSKEKAGKPGKVDPARDFDLLNEKFSGNKPQRYSMTGLFKLGDVIDHNTFGRGFVVSALNKRMEVIFSDQPRILVFDRKEMDI
ncbi:MAG: hypothetical protein JXA35_05535 [Deltaproteobacteria bacterium]|nr:hypothetical protein [Deltaproteobacteria bacterium]